MALYLYSTYINKANPNSVFDEKHKPGAVTPLSGIYRCVNCHREIVHTHEKPLPPQNHHQHPNATPILWQLLITDQKP
jgi:hypothetical protein